MNTTLRCVGERIDIALSRPERANALDADTVEALHAGVDQAMRDRPAAVVFRADGPHFCGGFDLTGLDDETDATLLLRFMRIGLLLERLLHLPCVTIALVDGAAIGAGADLVAACDHRLGTDRAHLSFPGIRFGAVLGSHRFASLTGPAAAPALLTGEPSIGPEDALNHQLLTCRHPSAADAAANADRIATQAGDLPRDQLPLLLAATRQPVAGTADAALAALTRSLAGHPGLADRLRAYAKASDSTQPKGER